VAGSLKSGGLCSRAVLDINTLEECLLDSDSDSENSVADYALINT
jgi:hypothetical protein